MSGYRWGMRFSHEDDAFLCENWGIISAEKIGKAIGGRSKNAVLGRAHRLNLRRLIMSDIRWSTEKRAAKKGKRKAPAPGRTTLKPLPSLAPVVAEVKAPAPPQPVPVLKPVVLSHNLCSWPIGDPRDRKNFRYCDAPALLGCVYCPVHEKIAYVKRDRREDA